jgi:outer membrane lipoprotein SlyB
MAEMITRAWLAATVVAACSGLAAFGAYAQSLDVEYGVVTEVNEIEFDEGGSPTGTVAGALAGGAVGYGIGRKKSSAKKSAIVIAGTAAGAWMGNKATKKTGTGYAYTVDLIEDNGVTITTEQGGIDAGDCVAIERGESANIRQVSEVHCQAGHTEPTKEHVAEAKECEAAKAAMLEAETDEALAAAVREARIRCEE